MANYRKSFNLRNGVQVDDDNFIVNANGLVGIGTSVPTEFLDVRGNAKVVGLTTTDTLYAGIATVGTLNATQGVSVSGVITATTFSGSAAGLTGIYAIAVNGWYVNGGSISTISNVGIGTTSPQGSLQIGTGITFNSSGDATYSGIITASLFDGSLDAVDLTGTIDNARLPSNINVTGVVTASSFNGNFVGTNGSLTQLQVTGVSTFTNGPVLIGTTSSTGTAAQPLQVSGGAYVSGNTGIGTTNATSELYVVGNTFVTGVVTASSFNGNIVGTNGSLTQLQVTGVSTFVNGPVLVGTASSTGTTNQVFQATGGAYVSGNTGIGTTNATSELYVVGNTFVTGIITASSFSGNASNATYAIEAGIATYSAVSGVSTSVIGGIGSVTQLQVTGVSTFTNGPVFVGAATSTGTASQRLQVTGGAYVSGNTGIGTANPTSKLSVIGDVSVSGVITAAIFSGNVTGNVTGNVIGNLTGDVTGTASTAQSLVGTPDITVGVVTASSISANTATATYISAFSTLYVGNDGTTFAALSSGNVGVGTSIPTSEVQIRKSNQSLLEVISDTSYATISIGQSVGVGKSTAVLRFGNIPKTFDIINNDTGSINSYLHAGPAGVGTGRFSWIYGQSNTELASLTYDGKFGIGITNPTSNLHVVGTSTVTGNANFGSDVTVTGTLTAGAFSGNIIIPEVLTNTNLNNNIGVTTVANLYVSPTGIGSIGIGTDQAIAAIDARSSKGLFASVGIGTTIFYGSEAFNVNGSILIPAGNVGIGTTYLDPAGAALQLYTPLIDLNGFLNLKSDSIVGFNTAEPTAIFDFGNVGAATTRPVMVVPNIGNSTRNGIGQTPTGAIIFNTNTSKFQGYTGVAWTDFH